MHVVTVLLKGGTLQKQRAIWVRDSVHFKTLKMAIWTKIRRVNYRYLIDWKYQLQNMTLIHWSFNRLVLVSGLSKGLWESNTWHLLWLPPTSYVPIHFVDVEIVLVFCWARFKPHPLASLKVLRRVWGRECEARHTQTCLSVPNIACCASNTATLQPKSR